MQITIITKEYTNNYFDVSSIEILTSLGWINILPNHSSLITDIIDSEMKLHTSNNMQKIKCSSGIVQVNNNKIVIIA